MSKLAELLEVAYEVCVPCGKKYGARPDKGGVSTFHYGMCDICDRDNVAVTEFRDFGYERKLLPRERFTKEHLEHE